MEEVVADLIKVNRYGANILRFSDMVREIAEFKYSDLYYNPKYENPWAHVRAGEMLTLWIIPK